MYFKGDAFEKAFITRNYICPECGKTMVFEDEYESILVCEHCGHSMDIDEYGVDPDSLYYPTREEVED